MKWKRKSFSANDIADIYKFKSLLIPFDILLTCCLEKKERKPKERREKEKNKKEGGKKKENRKKKERKNEIRRGKEGKKGK